MIHIKYVNTPRQLAHILTTGSFTGERWTKMTVLVNIVTHTTFVEKKCVSFFCCCESFIFQHVQSAAELFAASASAKQMPVLCTTTIARGTNDKHADMDYHAVPPPDYKAGGDSKREGQRQQDSERVSKTTPGASSSGQLEAAGASSSRLPQKILQVKKIDHLHSDTDGEYIKKFDDLADSLSRRAMRSAEHVVGRKSQRTPRTMGHYRTADG